MIANFELVESSPHNRARLFAASQRDERGCPVEGEGQLAALCLSLLPPSPVLSPTEQALIAAADSQVVGKSLRLRVVEEIQSGADPLGEWFTALRSSAVRRAAGAVYTPGAIFDPMIDWLRSQGTPARVVDPGAGSGRFVIAAGSAFPRARLIAVENDPLAALVLRTNLHLCRMSARAEVLVADYREIDLPLIEGVTAFVGNPPYVRHHQIAANWKAWYTSNFGKFGISASALAGLHLHFFLKTALLARDGDIGAFVTSAEWLDVNYGAALRHLLARRLGAVGLHILAPTVEVFAGTATTAAISCFRVGDERPTVNVRSVVDVEALGALAGGAQVQREQLSITSRWSSMVRPTRVDDGDAVAVGDLFRVHRGQVTGANAVWIFDDKSPRLPQHVLHPTITRAHELIRAGQRLGSISTLRRVVDLPQDLSGLDEDDLRQVHAFLDWAKRNGAHESYIARHRRAWWSVGLRQAAPILCTYMARRAPQFTLNVAGARHINVAHGLYPRQPMSDVQLANIVTWLNGNVDVGSGRTYAGGLTKFEPREVERLRIPLREMAVA